MQWRKAIEERISYLKSQEITAINELDALAAGTIQREVKWAFIREFSSRRSELEMFLNDYKDETPTTPTGWPGEELVDVINPERAQYLINVRDALVYDDISEAFHFLNKFYNPPMDKYSDTNWKDIEELAAKGDFEKYIHTAPKAEEEKYWISYGNDGAWLTAEEMKKEYQQLLEESEAEEPHRSAEEMIKEMFHFQPPLPKPDRKYFYEDVLFLMEAYHNQFKQSPSIKPED